MASNEQIKYKVEELLNYNDKITSLMKDVKNLCGKKQVLEAELVNIIRDTKHDGLKMNNILIRIMERKKNKKNKKDREDAIRQLLTEENIDNVDDISKKIITALKKCGTSDSVNKIHISNVK